MSGLRHVSDHAPGITRTRAGSGFSYRWPTGGIVRDQTTLARIRSLAIPPGAREPIWPDPACRTARSW
ncbi:MAG: hypothetical protein ABI880_05925, partial [Acidobacteriota bacterium]